MSLNVQCNKGSCGNAECVEDKYKYIYCYLTGKEVIDQETRKQQLDVIGKAYRLGYTEELEGSPSRIACPGSVPGKYEIRVFARPAGVA